MYGLKGTLFRTAIKTNLGLRKNSQKKNSGAEIRRAMLKGVNVLADAVAATMGPKGRRVIVDQRLGVPVITKDGFLIAKAIELKNKFQNLGAKLMKDVVYKTNEDVGDGTATAAVLARAFAQDGFEKVRQGADPIEVRRGINLAITAVNARLRMISRPVRTTADVIKVAHLSSNGDKSVSDLILSAVKKVSRNGQILARHRDKWQDKVEMVRGLKFNCGYISPAFINTPLEGKTVLKDALVLIIDKRLSSIGCILPVVEVATVYQRPLVLISRGVEHLALRTLAINRMKFGTQIVAINAPGFGCDRVAAMQDIAIATGGKVFESNCTLVSSQQVSLSDLGKVGEAIITRNETYLLRGEGDGSKIVRRTNQLRALKKQSNSASEKMKLDARIDRLTGRVALIYVGGKNEVETALRKKRVESALSATRAAIEEGIVPGGGTAFLRCIPALKFLQGFNKDQDLGIDIVRDALRQPCLTITQNAGVDSEMVVQHVADHCGDYGYDVMRAEFGDLVQMGIIDPTKILRTAITDAGDVASFLSAARSLGVVKPANED